jgi:hypothetical protein
MEEDNRLTERVIAEPHVLHDHEAGYISQDTSLSLWVARSESQP